MPNRTDDASTHLSRGERNGWEVEVNTCIASGPGLAALLRVRSRRLAGEMRLAAVEIQSLHVGAGSDILGAGTTTAPRSGGCD